MEGKCLLTLFAEYSDYLKEHIRKCYPEPRQKKHTHLNAFHAHIYFYFIEKAEN